MTFFADKLIDWKALGDVILISAIAGIAIALSLGFGVVSSLRAQDARSEGDGGAASLYGAGAIAGTLLVVAAVAVGIYYIVDK
jgi:UPF0716 family protein affecting phage T7 exclusion